MAETSQPIYFVAAAVVGIILSGLGYFIFETITTSNIFEKGVNLYKEKDFASAEANFRRVIERHRTNDMARLFLGNSLMAQNKLDEATPVFRELTERAPKNIDAYLRLGDALMKQNKLEEAIANLQKARELYKAPSPEQKQLEDLIEQIKLNTPTP